MKLGLGFKAGKAGGRERGQQRETRRPRAATMASTASGASRLPLAWLRLLLLGWLCAVVSQTTCASNGLQPLSDADREALAGYFTADADGFYGSLQETYYALRALEILEQSNVESQKICDSLVGLVQAPHDSVEDAFHVVRIAEVLQCPHGAEVAKVIVPSLQAAVEKAKSLLELHYSVATIAIIKKQGWSSKSASFNDALSGVFSSLKELAGPDGTWHYTKSSSESSAKAAGLAFGIAAAVVEVIGSDPHEDIGHIKTAAIKLFDNLESHDHGVFYFQVSKDDASSGGGGALEATWAVLRGSAALAAVLPAKLKVEVEKVFGIAKFLLTPGLALSATEAFYQLDSLSVLEDYRPAVPVSVQTSSILSLSSNDNLEVAVTTVLGKPVSQVKVTLVSAHCIGADAPPVWSSQNLNYVENSGKYVFHFLSATTDLGKYKLRLEVKSEGHSSYTSGGPVKSDITVISAIGISDVQLAVLDSNTGIPDFSAVLEYGKDENMTLSANHLQKLHLSLKLTSPSGSPFNPQQVFFLQRIWPLQLELSVVPYQWLITRYFVKKNSVCVGQVFLKLVHESHVEHLYLVKSSGKSFQLTLDFLGLVEKLQYLSGTYNVVLIVGDMTMENSFVWTLASLDLDLPAAPEGKPLPPKAPLEITAWIGPKPEIAHIFRQPQKRPPTLLSNIFLSLTLLPLIGFFIGLGYLGANIKLFPTTGLPGAAAVGFHGAVASILVFYFLFWLKLDLFTTLKVLGFLGLCTLPPGHFILSYLADSSAKQKTA